MFEFIVPAVPVIIVFCVLLAAVLYLILGFRRYVASVGRRVHADSLEEFPSPETFRYPSVSVIVYSEDDAPNLEVLLPQLLAQDYPAPFEVIVVNDGAVSATREVVGRLEKEHSNLYMTFTPMQSRSLSRKKLAVTIGIKAARYDVVVHTTGNCQIPSRLWLRAIGRRFVPGKDIVLGYAAPTAPDDTVREVQKRLHAFDHVLGAVRWLSWAIAGRPFRGSCHNLAYRRGVFFDNKGFSRSLDLKFGDDDVFVSQVATGANTAVELSADSMALCVQTDPSASHSADRLKYDFTASRLRGCARAVFGSFMLAWWLSIGCTVAVSILGLPSLWPLIAACVIELGMWVILSLAWKRTSLALWSRPIFLTFPWYMSLAPFYSMLYTIRGLSKRKSFYSWGEM